MTHRSPQILLSRLGTGPLRLRLCQFLVLSLLCFSLDAGADACASTPFYGSPIEAACRSIEPPSWRTLALLVDAGAGPPTNDAALVASDAEVLANPRARSARLRVGERTEHPPLM